REKVSFTKSHIEQELQRINQKYNIAVVILSTCNRTELYFASQEYLEEEKLKEIYHDFIKIKADFYIKRDEVLIDYLFELACGMHSLILGEDQIITQINDAIELSIEKKLGNSAINTLFRHSVTCAKRAKTEVNIKFISPSIVSEAIKIAKKEIFDLENKKVLVIGNGEMGRLSAKLFLKEKCQVYMTLRAYKYKTVEVPENCVAIEYDKKIELYSQVDIIVTATKSPHYTVHHKDIIKIEKKPKYIFDLALPRDVEPSIKEIEEIKIFSVDDIGKENSCYDTQAINEIKEIIKEQKIKFYKWFEYYKNVR
ncbi:MAG: NAD(P)-dependent oxidoreductase, partial [Clostridia bacterium]